MKKRTIFKLKIFKINVQVFFESWHTLYGNIFSEQFNAVFFFCYTLKHRAHIYSSTIFCYYVYINMKKTYVRIALEHTCALSILPNTKCVAKMTYLHFFFNTKTSLRMYLRYIYMLCINTLYTRLIQHVLV